MDKDDRARFGCPLPNLRPVCEQMVGSPARVPAVVDSDASICDQMMDMAVRLHWLAGGMLVFSFAMLLLLHLVPQRRGVSKP